MNRMIPTKAEPHLPANLRVDAIRKEIDQLAPWFHNINLHGIETAPDHFLGDYPRVKWERLSPVVPESLAGLSVLDIGCNGGFYSIEMKRRGAKRVLGIDSDQRYLAQAQLAARICEVDIEFIEMSIYDIESLQERFDLVLFMGVLYHLRHPLLGLDLITKHVMKDKLVLQTLQRGHNSVADVKSDYPFDEESVFNEEGYPVLHFVEKSYSHDPTNWWIPNRACTEAMIRSAGLEVLARPANDTYFCKLIDESERVRASR
jgi:tRNA (mo5U34)-methyltransferase